MDGLPRSSSEPTNVGDASERAFHMRADLSRVPGTPRLPPSSGSVWTSWLEMTRDWLFSFRSTPDPSVYVIDQTDGMDVSDGDAEMGGATGDTGDTGDTTEDMAIDVGRGVRRSTRTTMGKIPNKLTYTPPTPKSRKKTTRPVSTNVSSSTHGCSLIKLKAVITHICNSTTWSQKAVNDPFIWNEGPVSQGQRTFIFGTRNSKGRRVTKSVVSGDKLRKTFEINADASEQGGIYGGKREGQKGWMAIIKTRKEKRPVTIRSKSIKTKQRGGGSKRKSDNSVEVPDRDDVLYHEVEHILAATLKALFLGGCPGCPGRERLKQAIMESISAGEIVPSDKHVYRVEQLMQIYEEILSDMGERERMDNCIQHILYERLMDILFIKPEILACNQFKCSLNMLKPVFKPRGEEEEEENDDDDGESGAGQGGGMRGGAPPAGQGGDPYPVLKLEPDENEIRKIACRMVVGEDTIPSESGDYVRQKTRPFGGKVCAAKTLLDPTARYDINQPYGSPQENLHESGNTYINDTDVDDVIAKLVREFTKNTQSICKIFNSLDEIERQLLVAHSTILACINYSLISSDIIPGIDYPDWRMPLMACVRSSLEFIKRVHTDITLNRPTMSDTFKTCQTIMAEIEKLPFVDTDMHSSHWEHLISPIYPGFYGGRGKLPGLSPADLTLARTANPVIPCPLTLPPPAAAPAAAVAKQGGGMVKKLTETYPVIDVKGQGNPVLMTPDSKQSAVRPPVMPPVMPLELKLRRQLDIKEEVTPEKEKMVSYVDQSISTNFQLSFNNITKLLQENYGEEGLDSDKTDMLLSALFTGEILDVSYDIPPDDIPPVDIPDIHSGFKKGKKKKKKKQPIQTKRREQKKAKGRRSVASSSKKKKKKRKQTKKRKQKKSDKIIIDISGLRESFS